MDGLSVCRVSLIAAETPGWKVTMELQGEGLPLGGRESTETQRSGERDALSGGCFEMGMDQKMTTQNTSEN